ncbi:MAG: hypothetical protein NT062_09920, partial [Proteobacteria bacterium]|nr:hypothetical protein [Pseudomonadota bacterium]
DHVAIGGSDQVGGMMAPRDAAAAVERAWSRAAGAFDLTRVLGAIKPEGGAVVLVTDGLVADDAAAIAAAVKLGVPVHVVGVGPAPNRSLLGAIASATSGTVRIASTADDLGILAREVIADVASPPPPVAMTWGTLAASELVPATRPRIGAGQAMLVLARIKTAGPANGRARDGVFGMSMLPAPRAVAGATSSRGVLARRWARDRLDELLAKRDATATTAHALAYGLVSPYTTMVAIGDEVVVDGGVKHSVAVPVSVPAGMRWQEVQKQVRVETETITTKKVADKPADEKPAPKSEPKPTPETKPVPVPKVVAKPDVTRPVRKPIASGPAAPTVAPQADVPRETRDVGAAEDDGEFDDARNKRPSLDLDRGVAPAPMSPTSTGAARMSDGDDVREEVSIASYEGSARLRKRLAVSLGGGLVHQLDTAGLVALDARYEFGRATMVGVDTSLWLVDGLHVQGRALLSFARRGFFDLLELGGGVGLHLGDGAGPAWSLSLRLRPHAHGIGGFLRYDGAYVFDHGSGRGQAAVTGGVEYTF